MRYKLRVTKDDGSSEFVDIDANSYGEAKDIAMGEPDVIDVAPAKMVGSNFGAPQQSESRGMKEAIDQYVGTQQDVNDIVGF